MNLQSASSMMQLSTPEISKLRDDLMKLEVMIDRMDAKITKSNDGIKRHRTQ